MTDKISIKFSCANHFRVERKSIYRFFSRWLDASCVSWLKLLREKTTTVKTMTAFGVNLTKIFFKLILRLRKRILDCAPHSSQRREFCIVFFLFMSLLASTLRQQTLTASFDIREEEVGKIYNLKFVLKSIQQASWSWVFQGNRGVSLARTALPLTKLACSTPTQKLLIYSDNMIVTQSLAFSNTRNGQAWRSLESNDNQWLWKLGKSISKVINRRLPHFHCHNRA